jgi:hypothetical protein
MIERIEVKAEARLEVGRKTVLRTRRNAVPGFA